MSKAQKLVIDHIDIALGEILKKNPRATLKFMSKKLRLTPTPIHRRKKRLEECGFIKYQTTLDYEQVKLGEKARITYIKKNKAY